VEMSSGSGTGKKRKERETGIMRAAFLHLDLSGGPEERNLELLEKAVRLAAHQGAEWVVTPEMAVQGYFFAKKATELQVPVQPYPSLRNLRDLAAGHQLTVFLGCAEQDPLTGKPYNSCLVIGPDGETLGRHRKTRSHGVGAEAWMTKGDRLEPIACREMTAGVLVCSDVWYVENSQALQGKGAEVIVVLAAWPPGECGPGDCWERVSLAAGLPIWVCNQTGNGEELDFSEAQSAVVIEGEKRLAYSGLQQAVLLFDWDPGKRCLKSTQFTVVAVEDA
jgi:predicted amidohydrolase